MMVPLRYFALGVVAFLGGFLLAGYLYTSGLASEFQQVLPEPTALATHTSSPPIADKKRVAILLMGQYRTFQDDLPRQLGIYCAETETIFDLFVLVVCSSEKETSEEPEQRKKLINIIESACSKNFRIAEYFTHQSIEEAFSREFVEERYAFQHELRPLVAQVLNISDKFMQNRFTPNLYAYRYWLFRKMLAYQNIHGIFYYRVVYTRFDIVPVDPKYRTHLASVPEGTLLFYCDGWAAGSPFVLTVALNMVHDYPFLASRIAARDPWIFRELELLHPNGEGLEKSMHAWAFMPEVNMNSYLKFHQILVEQVQFEMNPNRHA